MKQETALLKLYRIINTSERLGAKFINPDALLSLIDSLYKYEKQLIKNAFKEGREFQGYKENESIPFESSSEEYFFDDLTQSL